MIFAQMSSLAFGWIRVSISNLANTIHSQTCCFPETVFYKLWSQAFVRMSCVWRDSCFTAEVTVKTGSFSSTGRGSCPLLYGASASLESQDALNLPSLPPKTKLLWKNRRACAQAQGPLSASPKPKLFPWWLCGWDWKRHLPTPEEKCLFSFINSEFFFRGFLHAGHESNGL